MIHVALTEESRSRPLPLNCIELQHLLSCLHAIGCAFVVQKIDDWELNTLIRLLEKRAESLPLSVVVGLAGAMTRMDWKILMDEVADMHGDVNRDRYRKTAQEINTALRDASQTKQNMLIAYVDWGHR